MLPCPVSKSFFPRPRHLVQIFRVATLIFGVAAAQQHAWAAPVVGTSAAVSGRVFVATRGAERRAQVRDEIKLQDRILTKDNSALQILLLDRSTFTVGQNCNMVINKFVYDPTTDAGKIGAKVVKGAFRFMSGRIGQKDPTNASVSTPSATIGIRGTFFEGIVGEDAVALAQLGGVDTRGAVLSQASAIVLRGPGRRRNTLDKPGVVTVSNARGSARLSQPDYAVFVGSENSVPVGPFRLTQEMREYLDFFLRSEPSGRGENPLDIVEDGSLASGQSKFQTPVVPIDPFLEEVQDGLTDPNGSTQQPPPPPEPPTVPTQPDPPTEPITPEPPTVPTQPDPPTEPITPDPPGYTIGTDE